MLRQPFLYFHVLYFYVFAVGIIFQQPLHSEEISSVPWTVTQVPSVASSQHPSHYSWYRCYVKTPDNWAAESTSVFTETINLAIEHLTDSHEAYVNGVKVGGEGMPPNFRSSREETNKYKIPKGVIKKKISFQI